MPHPNGQLTTEEIEPDADDMEYAEHLVDAGWYSISSKYRIVARLRSKPLPLHEYMNPELIDTPWGKIIFGMVKRMHPTMILRMNNKELVEERTLTVRQFRAFKLHGGRPA